MSTLSPTARDLDWTFLARSLGRYVGDLPADAGGVTISDLSPGLSSSKICRVTLGAAPTPRRFVVKIPDWCSASGLQVTDPPVTQRERLFLETGLPALLPAPLSLPDVLGIDCSSGKTLIWMEDLGDAFPRRWSPSRARAAVAASAQLHQLYRCNLASIERLTWLARDMYRLFDLYRPAAWRNLETLERNHRSFTEFGSLMIDDLKRCLDRHEWACNRLGELRQTLAHGDFHPRNIGFRDDGRVVLVDWCNIGLCPLGSDLATFISLYGVFGGGSAGAEWRPLEAELVDTYCTELRRLDDFDGDLHAAVERCIWLWAITWGLHLRLGPALGAILDGKITNDRVRLRTVADIVEGCERASAGIGWLP